MPFRILTPVGLLGACALGGYLTGGADGADSTLGTSGSARQPGMAGSLKLEIEPLSVGGDQLDLALNIGSTFASNTRFQYAMAITDDLGNLVEPQRVSGIVRMGKNAKAERAESVGGDLDDGYYAVHVNAVGVAKDEQEAVSADLYFEVRNGQATPIEEGTYFAYSDGLQATEAPSEKVANPSQTPPVTYEREVSP